MTRFITLMAALTLALALAAPAFAVDASAGAGKAFGEHHASHAEDMTGFTAEMNPGVTHLGFSGWQGM